MAIHCQLLFSTILYVLVFLSSIIELSSVAYSKNSLNGYCFLFAKIGESDPKSVSCNVNIYACAAAAIYAAIMAFYHGYGTFVASRESHIGRTMWVMPWLLMNTFMMILTFISACVYSVGVYITCSQDSIPSKMTESCSLKSEKFRSVFTGEVSGWLSVFLWACLIAVEAVRLMRNRRALTREVYVDPTTSDVMKIGDVVPTA